MRKFLNTFTLLFAIFLIAGACWLLIYQKGDLVLYLNDSRTPFADQFFKYITWLGDGLILIPFVFTFLFISYYKSINLAFVSVFILLFSQGLKKTIFNGWPRPTAYFGSEVEWNVVEGVKIATNNTFPSGHTITAFAVFFLLSLIINKRWGYILCFILALSAGFSRVYLLQHFFVDIYFGSALGVLSVIIGMKLSETIFPENKYPKLHSKSLIK